MPILYMLVWSLVIIIGLSIWRLQDWGERATVTLITFLVLLVTQSLFFQLTAAAGVNATDALLAPQTYVASGPVGWMALLVMPCGWLGPFIGMNLVERAQTSINN